MYALLAGPLNACMCAKYSHHSAGRARCISASIVEPTSRLDNPAWFYSRHKLKRNPNVYNPSVPHNNNIRATEGRPEVLPAGRRILRCAAMLCPCPKLTPLQSRLLASVLTLVLLGVVYWALSHPHIAYAAELDYDGGGRLRGGEDHNWHRIALEEVETYWAEGVDAEDDTGTAVLSARAPAVSTTGGNNVPNTDNIEPGGTTVWEFTNEQLNSRPAERGPGLPRDLPGVEDDSLQHTELRRREVATELESGDDLNPRQSGRSKTIYVSINTCLQPDYVRSGTQSAPPPQLTLYVATDSSNQKPGPNVGVGSQTQIPLEEGYAATQVTANGNWYMSVHAPELPNDFSGVWNYELAVSIDDYYHQLNRTHTNLYLLDTDSNAALLVTNNLTQSNASTESYRQWVELAPPFIMFASNTNGTRSMGLSQSFCGLKQNAQIDGNSTNVQMEMITRGLGNKPKEQFYVTALNRSSSYVAILAMDGNSTNSGQGVVGGGGKVWQTIQPFRTKSDGNCALLFDLDFCSEVAYAVPSTPDIVSNHSHFKSIYDDYTLKYYHNFNYSLQQIPCSTTADAQYSLAKNCDDCAKAYKEWLCVVSIPRCEDFSSDAKHLHRRNMGQKFINGTMLPSSILEHPYTPMSNAPTLEGTVAYSQTYISSMATNSSPNPIIDNQIAPGPYKEVLPCEDLCWGLMPKLSCCPRFWMSVSWQRSGGGVWHTTWKW